MRGFEIAEAIEQNCDDKTSLQLLPALIDKLDLICTKAVKEIKGEY